MGVTTRLRLRVQMLSMSCVLPRYPSWRPSRLILGLAWLWAAIGAQHRQPVRGAYRQGMGPLAQAKGACEQWPQPLLSGAALVLKQSLPVSRTRRADLVELKQFVAVVHRGRRRFWRWGGFSGRASPSAQPPASHQQTPSLPVCLPACLPARLYLELHRCV